MTELANGRDVVVATAQPHRIKKPAKLSAKQLEQKRLAPFLVTFLGKVMGPVLKDIGAQLKKLERENLALQHRLAVAESTVADRAEIKKIKAKLARFETALDDAMIYRGVWRQDHTFERGSSVSHDGSLWFAKKATDRRPGTPDSGWRLTVKHGSWE